MCLCFQQPQTACHHSNSSSSVCCSFAPSVLLFIFHFLTHTFLLDFKYSIWLFSCVLNTLCRFSPARKPLSVSKEIPLGYLSLKNFIFNNCSLSFHQQQMPPSFTSLWVVCCYWVPLLFPMASGGLVLVDRDGCVGWCPALFNFHSMGDLVKAGNRFCILTPFSVLLLKCSRLLDLVYQKKKKKSTILCLAKVPDNQSIKHILHHLNHVLMTW